MQPLVTGSPQSGCKYSGSARQCSGYASLRSPFALQDSVNHNVFVVCSLRKIGAEDLPGILHADEGLVYW